MYLEAISKSGRTSRKPIPWPLLKSLPTPSRILLNTALPSTDLPASSPIPPAEIPQWRAAGLSYYSLKFYLQQTFGGRVRKVSLDGGFACPNRDGTVSHGGCIFCDPASFSPSRRTAPQSIDAQLEAGAVRCRKQGAERFIAYFQPGTNTYGPVERLRALFQQALAYPGVVGLAVGTRPDCMSEEVLQLLSDLSQQAQVTVEYGLQTIHNRTLRWMNRGHDYASFLDAVTRSQHRNLRIATHVILGLPGESAEDMQATARELARLEIDAVKIHNLHVVQNTPLAEQLAAGYLRLPALDEYVGFVVEFLEELPERCVIERLSGDAPAQFLVAPQWSLAKSAVKMAIEAEFARRRTWQGQGRKELGVRS